MKKLLLTTVLLFSLNNSSYSQGNNVFISDNMEFTTTTPSLRTNNTIVKPKPNRNTNNTLEKDTNKTKKIKKEIINVNKTQMVNPNPAKDYINIKTIPNSQVKILNKEGLIVKSFKNVFGESFIDIRDLNKGLYYITIFEPGTKKISREKLQIK